MPLKVAINGFGRIGRTAFRAGLKNKGLEFVAINDLTDNKTLAHLLKYDSIYGRLTESVDYNERELIVSGKKIQSFSQKDPAKLPWAELGVEVVLECTGVFRTKELASAHLKAGAKKVIISAPSKDQEIVPTYVPGVNLTEYVGEEIVDMASCTTNCVAPLSQIMCENLGVKKALLSTVHSYTANQNLVDGPHKDLRRGRAAVENIVLTTTGAAEATIEVLPDMKNIFDGLAVRVPIETVSLADIVYLVKKKTTVEGVNQIFSKAVQDPRYQGIVAVAEEELVSRDFKGNSHSAIVDLEFTRVIAGDLVKIMAWYDNEWGYASRLVEMAAVIGAK